MSEIREYNPLDYDNLTKGCVEELMQRGPYALPPNESFRGAGVYALFYHGNFEPYLKISSPDCSIPIYVGKAIPPGGRKGGIDSSLDNMSLFSRLNDHAKSIASAENLDLKDFSCRFLVVTPLWITMAERFLIEHYQPIWNVCIEGFGNHDPGAGRHQGEIAWWDALHPGRSWAMKLAQGKNSEMAKERLATFLTAK